METCTYSIQDVVRSYDESASRLILLDYDGTLVPFASLPQLAVPDPEVLLLLKRLCVTNTVYVISGRDRVTLEEWLGALPIGLVAEHGAAMKAPGETWRMLSDLNTDWKSEAVSRLQDAVHRCPGSLIEEKEFSVSWHYRNASENTVATLIPELTATLEQPFSQSGLELLYGNKVIEIRCVGADKGHAARSVSAAGCYDFILSAGDDLTDEGMFIALKEVPYAYTFRIGAVPQTEAKFSFGTRYELLELLRSLIGSER
ncbi:MAG: trehalose-phosphatase [Chitinophagaceae bacterium]